MLLRNQKNACLATCQKQSSRIIKKKIICSLICIIFMSYFDIVNLLEIDFVETMAMETLFIMDTVINLQSCNFIIMLVSTYEWYLLLEL